MLLPIAPALEPFREDLLALLAELAGADAAQLTTARGEDLESAQVFDAPIPEEVARSIADDVRSHAESLVFKEWLAYDPSYSLSGGQAFVDSLDEVPELRRLHRIVSSEYREDGLGQGPVVALSHRLSIDGGPAVTAYRMKGPGIATRTRRDVHAFRAVKGRFVEVEQDLLTYEPRFDALVVGDRVLVTATTTLPRVLGSTARLRDLARQTFLTATKKVDIEGADALVEAVQSDPTMASKMAQLARNLENDPDYAKLLTTENLLDFLDRNPAVQIATTGEGTQRRLVFEPSPRTRYAIVKLLADDYLWSDLSKRSYEAGSKAQLDE